MHDMLRNNLTDLRKLQAEKKAKQEELQMCGDRLEGSRRYLRALQSEHVCLQEGELGAVMHPNPLPLTYKEKDCISVFGDLPVPAVCAMCLEGFPFWYALICSCKHLYHPWYAAAWFLDSSDCVAIGCGRVHPFWLKACRFSFAPAEECSGATRDTVNVSAVVEGMNVESF